MKMALIKHKVIILLTIISMVVLVRLLGCAVALLEAEHITSDATANRGELTGWLDAMLADSLPRQKNLAVLDRQLLDKVLAEKKLDAARADGLLTKGPMATSDVLSPPNERRWRYVRAYVLRRRADLLATQKRSPLTR